MELLKQLATYSCEYEDRTGYSLLFQFYYIEGNDNPSIWWAKEGPTNKIICWGTIESISENEDVISLLKKEVE